MSTFKEYLAESVKQYDYKIKVAGDLDKGFNNKLETSKSWIRGRIFWLFSPTRRAHCVGALSLKTCGKNMSILEF